jgi:hypothetical protein
LLFARNVVLCLGIVNFELDVRGFGSGMLLQLVLGIETASEHVRSGHERQFVWRKNNHWNEKLFRVVKLLGCVPAFGAALDSAGQLRKVKDAEMRFRVALGVVIEGASNGFRSDQAKVVQIVGSGGVRIIAIHDAASECGAILRDTIEVILVGLRIEFGDERAILVDGRFDDEDVNAAFQCGADHFAPFSFIAGEAGFAVAVTG